MLSKGATELHPLSEVVKKKSGVALYTRYLRLGADHVQYSSFVRLQLRVDKMSKKSTQKAVTYTQKNLC